MEPRRVVFFSAGSLARPLLAAAPLIGRALGELGVAPVDATPVADLVGREYHAIVVFCDAGDT